MTKKFVAFLLATVMVSQISMTAFAEVQTGKIVETLNDITVTYDESKQVQYADVTGPEGKPDGTLYVALLGDSIAAGMGTSGTEGYNNSNARRTYNNPINTSYPYLIAERIFSQLNEEGYFGSEVEFPITPAAVTGSNGKSFKWANFGIAGYRLSHFAAMLSGEDVEYKSESMMDEKWWSGFWDQNQNMNKVAAKGIAEADVIAINLGSNDVLQHYLSEMFERYVHSKTGNHEDADNFTFEVLGVIGQQLAPLFGYGDYSATDIDTTALKEAAEKVEANPLIMTFAMSYFLLFLLSVPLETVLIFAADLLAILEMVCPVNTEDLLEFLTFIDQKNIENKLGCYIKDAEKDYDTLIAKIREVNPKATITVMSAFTPYGTSLYGNTSWEEYSEETIKKYNLPYVTEQIYNTLIDALFENPEDAKFNLLSDSLVDTILENKEAKLNLKGEGINAIISILGSLEELGVPADAQLEWFFNVIKTINDVMVSGVQKTENLNDIVRLVLNGDALEITTAAFGILMPKVTDEMVDAIAQSVQLLLAGTSTVTDTVKLIGEALGTLVGDVLNPTETVAKLVLQSVLLNGTTLLASGIALTGILTTAIEYYNYVTNYEDSYMAEGGYELPAWIGLDDLEEWSHAQLYITAYFSEILSGKEVKHSAVFDIDNTNPLMPFRFVELKKDVTEGYEKGLKGVLQFLGEVADRVFGTSSSGTIVTNFQKMIEIFSAFRSGNGSILELQKALQDIADTGIVFTLA
ncbi:MAG: hypothetical protein Q4E99_01335, partial [Bacillota bacterium]|nr:hypothetical protein [Bacillota bacterium]